MANADTPMGLVPIASATSRPFRVRPYYVASTYATGIFIGSAVIKVAGGSNTAAVTVIGGGTYDIGTLAHVEAATVGDTNAITGVCVGVLPVTRDSAIYGAASTERVILVADDLQNTEFLIQADGAVPAASIGLNAVLIATHAGSTVTGISGLELDTTSDAPAADASNQLLILRQSNAPDNTPNLIHNNVVVKIVQDTDQGAAGIGI